MPVVNENDAIADDEIRFGDNDRMAALVAHLIGADLLVLLTDTPGLLTADPRSTPTASLIEEIVEVDHALERMAGGIGQRPGERGHGLEAGGGEDRRLVGRAGGDRRGRPAGRAGRGRRRRHRGGHGGRCPGPRRLPARKLWIAFAVGSSGIVIVDEGARRALLERGVSLLPAGVTGVKGSFEADDAVEIAGPDGVVFAKGLVPARRRRPAARSAGMRTSELPEGIPHEVVHRDDLVVLP